ncbi:hypothetical protein RDWZM_001840 [Blomia tropicalis]|uniref:Pyrroline-5-carboxylate reductase 3 n=1 Tax=Blomia tropicalis TaxID=40697 RepID=A0A9Q0MGT5_BLOTA|nr:hypothetical protein BLOT_007978 [Blomia tropicalis]KAJ6223295.1 hypothetical protein RDWZM_001840 [Blomia tropicalis]
MNGSDDGNNPNADEAQKSAEPGGETAKSNNTEGTEPKSNQEAGGNEPAPVPQAAPPKKPDSPGGPVKMASDDEPYRTGSEDAKGGSPAGGTGIGGQRPTRRKKGDRITLQTARMGFIGAGKMADAIIRGLITHGKVNPQCIYVSSKSGRTLDNFKTMGTITTKRSYDIFGRFDCDVIFLVTHGFVVKECYKMGGSRPMALTINYIPNQRHPLYLLTMAGGVTTNELKNTLLNPEKPDKYQMSLNRCMVNPSVAYGLGLAAIDVEPDSKKFFPILRDIFSSVAKYIEYVPENNMDQACAVGGNGMAFCYYFLTALADGGFKMGLPKNVAVKFAAKTLLAAGTSLLESNKNPSELKDHCTSPSGPAIYGVHLLDKQDCSSGIASAVEGAFKRIKELAEHPL